MKVSVDKQKCIGCGTCIAIAPESFKLGDDGKVQTLEPMGDSEAKVKEAAESCPVSAITVTQ